MTSLSLSVSVSVSVSLSLCLSLSLVLCVTVFSSTLKTTPVGVGERTESVKQPRYATSSGKKDSDGSPIPE